MKTWDQFRPLVAPHVMGCPIPVIDLELCRAAREFCTTTQAWREWVDAFTADGTTNQFDYPLVNGQELVRVLRGIRNQGATDRDKLTVTAGSGMPDDWETGDSLADEAQDTIVHFEPSTFKVFPLPASGDTFRMEMAFRPSLDATGVGDVIYTDFAEAIGAGATARILSTPRQPWSDMTHAGIKRGEFNDAITTAANRPWALRGASARRTKKTRL